MSQPNLNEDLNIVANSNLEITLLDGDLNIIQALDDEPNDVGGLTSAELKAKFDEGPNKIKEYINGTLIPEILTEEATEAARAAAEAQREANETQRIENENARIAAEQARVDETNGVVAQAAAQAKAAAESAAQAKQIAIGDIPDGTLPESKLVEEARAAIDRAKVGGEIDAILNAAEYSSAQTYALGDYCKHDGKLYRCMTAITEAEAWTDAHWTETSVTAELVAIYTTLQKKADKSVAFTVSLTVAGWSNNAQTVSNAKFLPAGYAYTVAPTSSSFADYADAMVYADDVTADGQMVFHCDSVPAADLTVNIVRMVTAE